MTAHRLAAGEALALGRPLATRADPLSLYAALSEGGARRDTMLIERTAGPTLILDRPALRVECRGQDVVVTATDSGRTALASLKEHFAERVLDATPDRATLRFPRVAGADPSERLLASSPLDVLRFLAGGFSVQSPEEPFTLAALGVVAFDHVDLIEDLPGPAADPLQFPDYLFWLASSLVVIEPGGAARLVVTAFGETADESGHAYFDAVERLRDLEQRCTRAKTFVPSAAPEATEPAKLDLPDPEFEELVRAMKEHIAAGDVYQIVPSRTFRAPCPDPLSAFARLRRRDPSPYHFFVAGPDHILFGASPETSVRIFQGTDSPMVEVKPIAGTRRRGATEDEDDRLEAEMRLDHKELAEHMMLVDLARNDVARVSERGSRRVAGLLTVERYARVMHLVSSVTGRLRSGYDAVHVLQACLNVGTLSGAPKIRATELLRLAERTKRGPYGGAIGWMNGAGLLDTGVIIRSAVVQGDTAFVRAGAGVVHDSDPAAEADETRRKASALLSVLGATV